MVKKTSTRDQAIYRKRGRLILSKVISKEEEEYTLSLIEDLSDPYKREVGLEKLCDILNKGFLLNNPNKVADRLIARVQDDAKKVVRWALNALALLSRLTRKINPNLIVEAIENPFLIS